MLNSGLERDIANFVKRFLIDAIAYPSSDALATVIVTPRQNESNLDAGRDNWSLSAFRKIEPQVTCYCGKSPLSHSDFDQENSPIRKNAAKARL